MPCQAPMPAAMPAYFHERMHVHGLHMQPHAGLSSTQDTRNLLVCGISGAHGQCRQVICAAVCPHPLGCGGMANRRHAFCRWRTLCMRWQSAPEIITLAHTNLLARSQVFKMSEAEVIRCGGMDAAMYVKILEMGEHKADGWQRYIVQQACLQNTSLAAAINRVPRVDT